MSNSVEFCVTGAVGCGLVGDSSCLLVKNNLPKSTMQIIVFLSVKCSARKICGAEISKRISHSFRLIYKITVNKLLNKMFKNVQPEFVYLVTLQYIIPVFEELLFGFLFHGIVTHLRRLLQLYIKFLMGFNEKV